MSRVLKLAGAIDNDQHAVAGVGALFARSQIQRDSPVIRLFGRRDFFDNGIVKGDAVGRGAVAEDETDGDSIGIMVFWVPRDGVLFALSHGL